MTELITIIFPIILFGLFKFLRLKTIGKIALLLLSFLPYVLLFVDSYLNGPFVYDLSGLISFMGTNLEMTIDKLSAVYLLIIKIVFFFLMLSFIRRNSSVSFYLFATHLLINCLIIVKDFVPSLFINEFIFIFAMVIMFNNVVPDKQKAFRKIICSVFALSLTLSYMGFLYFSHAAKTFDIGIIHSIKDIITVIQLRPGPVSSLFLSLFIFSWILKIVSVFWLMMSRFVNSNARDTMLYTALLVVYSCFVLLLKTTADHSFLSIDKYSLYISWSLLIPLVRATLLIRKEEVFIKKITMFYFVNLLIVLWGLLFINSNTVPVSMYHFLIVNVMICMISIQNNQKHDKIINTLVNVSMQAVPCFAIFSGLILIFSEAYQKFGEMVLLHLFLVLYVYRMLFPIKPSMSDPVRNQKNFRTIDVITSCVLLAFVIYLSIDNILTKELIGLM